MVGCLLMIFTYHRSPKWRQHPGVIIYTRSVLEFLFALFFFMNLILSPGCWLENSIPCDDHNVTCPPPDPALCPCVVAFHFLCFDEVNLNGTDVPGKCGLRHDRAPTVPAFMAHGSAFPRAPPTLPHVLPRTCSPREFYRYAGWNVSVMQDVRARVCGGQIPDVRATDWNGDPVDKSVRSSVISKDEQVADLTQVADTLGYVVAVMFHATFFASEVLVGALAVDLMLSVINPFVSYKQTTRRTLVFCFLFTVFTTALIIAWDAIGPTDFGFCWIKCSKRGTVNLHRSVTLYAPLLTIWIICCTSLLFAWWRLRRGLKRTLQTRRQVLKSLSIYVFGYLLYYAVLVTIYGVVFFFLDDKWLQHKGANTALLLLLGGRGTWHLIAWMVSRGWRDIGILKNTAVANDADYDYSPQLNRALRKEVLYYTKKGMLMCAIQANQQRLEGDTNLTITIPLQEDQPLPGASWDGPSSQGGSHGGQGRESPAASPYTSERDIASDSPLAARGGATPDGRSGGGDGLVRNRTWSEQETDEFDKVFGGSFIEPSALVAREEGGGGEEKSRSRRNGTRKGKERNKKGGVHASLLDNDCLDVGSMDGMEGTEGLEMRLSNRDLLNASGGAGGGRRTLEVHSSFSDGSDVDVNGSTSSDGPDYARVRPVAGSVPAYPSNHGGDDDDQNDDGSGDGNGDGSSGRSHRVNRVTTSDESAREVLRQASAEAGRGARGARGVEVHAHTNAPTFNVELRAHTDGPKFQDYSPGRFAELRRLMGVGLDEYLGSLSKTTRERFSEGASGAFLYFSKDDKYIVKTCSLGEAQKLHTILPLYVEYIRNNPGSRITRFTGLHSIKLYRTTMYFVVMSNVFCGVKRIDERYDLKGSTVGRNAAPVSIRNNKTYTCHDCQEWFRIGDKDDKCSARPNKRHRPSRVLKDNDLNWKLRMEAVTSRDLTRQLKLDSEWLCGMGLMDYSLLLGVQRVAVHNTSNEGGKGGGGERGERARGRATVAMAKMRRTRGSGRSMWRGRERE
jgi:hypothetical protein